LFARGRCNTQTTTREWRTLLLGSSAREHRARDVAAADGAAGVVVVVHATLHGLADARAAQRGGTAAASDEALVLCLKERHLDCLLWLRFCVVRVWCLIVDSE
jgi:hypothetical protein